MRSVGVEELVFFIKPHETFVHAERSFYYKASQNHRKHHNQNGFHKCGRLPHALPAYQIGGRYVSALLGD